MTKRHDFLRGVLGATTSLVALPIAISVAGDEPFVVHLENSPLASLATDGDVPAWIHDELKKHACDVEFSILYRRRPDKTTMMAAMQYIMFVSQPALDAYNEVMGI